MSGFMNRGSFKAQQAAQGQLTKVVAQPEALRTAKQQVRNGVPAAEAAKPLSFAQAEKLVPNAFPCKPWAECAGCGVPLTRDDKVLWCNNVVNCRYTNNKSAEDAGVKPVKEWQV